MATRRTSSFLAAGQVHRGAVLALRLPVGVGADDHHRDVRVACGVDRHGDGVVALGTVTPIMTPWICRARHSDVELDLDRHAGRELGGGEDLGLGVAEQRTAGLRRGEVDEQLAARHGTWLVSMATTPKVKVPVSSGVYVPRTVAPKWLLEAVARSLGPHASVSRSTWRRVSLPCTSW